MPRPDLWHRPEVPTTGATVGYTGFPTATLEFLTELRANNDRDWFQAHREDYETGWLGPGTAFVEAAGEELATFAPAVHAEPRVNGSLFRINRDIRFSKDKTPYKDHLDLWFWEGERKGAVSGFFVRVTPEEVVAGAGAHHLGDRLAAYRDAVVDVHGGTALLDAVEAVEATGHPVEGERYKRLPRGYDAEGERARLLRHDALFSHATRPTGAWVHSPEVLDWTVARWRELAPIHRWLVDTLG